MVVTSAGMVLTAAFTLRALKQAFFGEKKPSEPLKCDPISMAEKLGAALLMTATLVAGLYPKPLFDRILPAVEAMQWLKR